MNASFDWFLTYMLHYSIANRLQIVSDELSSTNNLLWWVEEEREKKNRRLGTIYDTLTAGIEMFSQFDNSTSEHSISGKWQVASSKWTQTVKGTFRERKILSDKNIFLLHLKAKFSSRLK